MLFSISDMALRNSLIESVTDMGITILGAEVTIPLIKGQMEFEVPKGTQSGEMFRIRGKGLRNVHGRGVGDLLVRLHVETPRRLTERQEELLREFAEGEEISVSPRRKSFFDKLKDLFAQEEDED